MIILRINDHHFFSLSANLQPILPIQDFWLGIVHDKLEKERKIINFGIYKNQIEN
jgi:hypothetical protein